MRRNVGAFLFEWKVFGVIIIIEMFVLHCLCLLHISLIDWTGQFFCSIFIFEVYLNNSRKREK